MVDGDKNLAYCLQHFSRLELPVLQDSITVLARLQQNEEHLTARDLAAVVLQDPLLSLKLLRHMQQVRRNTQPTEVTTVVNAIMMLGISPFFQAFKNLTAVETVLKDRPDALQGFRRVVSRAQHAAIYARDWSIIRHDIAPHEVVLATLLHDLAEMLLWIFGSKYALQIREIMLQNPSKRSAMAQTKVLGFPLHHLQLELAKAWHLPALLQDLLDDERSHHPRVINVRLAVMLARHSANGWDDKALPDDYRAISAFTGFSEDQTYCYIIGATLEAARNWRKLHILPTATHLPKILGPIGK